jgi:S-formylglutathione hydrolase
MTTLQPVSRSRCFDGYQDVYKHASQVLRCEMRVGVYLPPQASSEPRPALYWLSGLTCTEQNFITKAGAQRLASSLGLVLIVPDTSPRGEGVPDELADDLGQGAGFYLNATREPWSAHFQMYDYITRELPAWVEENLPVLAGARGIFGHSMGGHGALSIALKNPGLFRSVSAIAPIVAPSQVPWGQKAFRAYLGDDESTWKAYDTVELIAGAKERLPLLVSQGEADPFLQKQLKPELLEAACQAAGHPLRLRRHAGYDHGYYFIASVIDEHLQHHAAALLAS